VLPPRDGRRDHFERGGAGRRTFSLHTFLVAALARTARTLCFSAGKHGTVGIAGFLVAFTATYLMGVGGNFGFFAPLLAKEAPATLDAIARYWPVAVINGLAAIAFMIGFVLFGIAMTKTALPRWSGVW
jgi:hypothetical protein